MYDRWSKDFLEAGKKQLARKGVFRRVSRTADTRRSDKQAQRGLFRGDSKLGGRGCGGDCLIVCGTAVANASGSLAYALLSNPLYIGRSARERESYEGQHAAIIDPETWDAVQKQLATQTPSRSEPAMEAACAGDRTMDWRCSSGSVLEPSRTRSPGARIPDP